MSVEETKRVVLNVLKDLERKREQIREQMSERGHDVMDSTIVVVKSGIFGTAVGDAIGVPVEFSSRSERQNDPVTDMREYGTHNQPKGTWSDDSSMMFATMDSMIQKKGFSYEDIIMKFQDWRFNGAYTPHGNVFDVGITCSRAISRYRPGVNPLDCGEKSERDNGNGSLMRIMPAALYFAIQQNYWEEAVLEDAVETIQNISRLTHAHPRSQIACVLYTSICHELIYRGDRDLEDALGKAVSETLHFYETEGVNKCWFDTEFHKEMQSNVYQRLRNISLFKMLRVDEIYSSGYVVHTLEAAVWCLLNTKSYAECVLRAVNLGEDTDTTGAVAGGLAGLCYGYESIPTEWVSEIVSKEWIETLCEDLSSFI